MFGIFAYDRTDKNSQEVKWERDGRDGIGKVLESGFELGTTVAELYCRCVTHKKAIGANTTFIFNSEQSLNLKNG